MSARSDRRYIHHPAGGPRSRSTCSEIPIGIVDRRNSAEIQGWLDARTEAWREVVRNHRHYQALILLRSHRQTRQRRTRFNQQATTANC
jgi:hypothetical protein